MTRFDILRKSTDVSVFAETIRLLAKHTKDKNELVELLSVELTKYELEQFIDLARHGYPLSLDGIQ